MPRAAQVALISIVLLIPCFWQGRIQTVDLPSHIYNSWLAQQIESGKARGLAIVPMSTNRTSLKATIDSLAAGGSTAGQIGAAWGWYMLSPNFAYLWPSASQPAAYTQVDVLKVMVFMTDGDFNTAYCNNVLSNDSQGYNSDQINCNATNGNSTTQAQAICTAAKAKGVIIYTVGFQVGSGSTAETFIKGCATDADHVYLPTSGTLLKDAFSAIGRDITKLRLSK